MKYIFTNILLLFCCSLGYSQYTYEWGQKFEFDSKSEVEPEFVLKDNYNHYMLTLINADGMMADHRMIIRKFDQKNQMVEKMSYEFPKMDAATFFNYLGFVETGNGKIVVFTETHSGRTKKSEISKHEFDKASGKFTTTVLLSNPIASLSKNGRSTLSKSENGKHACIRYTINREKGVPEKNIFIMLESNTLTESWKKEVLFENEFTSQDAVATNSGKLVLVRDMKGSKKGLTYLTVLSGAGQEDKTFESQIFFNEMKAISIGTEDYIVAFNSSSKDFRSDFFNKLLLYDLKSGEILQNNKVSEFAEVKELADVYIRKIYLQNNEIHIFTEAKVSVPFQAKTGYSATSMLETKYRFGPTTLYVLSFEGQLKQAEPLAVSPSEAELYHSFGVLNIKGKYCVNTGGFSGIGFLNPLNKFSIESSTDGPGSNLPEGYGESRFINQLLAHFPDGNRLLAGMVVNVGEMALVNIKGLK